MTTYNAEQLQEFKDMLEALPPLEQQFFSPDEALAELKPTIRDLYQHKNYSVRQIFHVLRNAGVKVKMKNVKEAVSDILRPVCRIRKNRIRKNRVIGAQAGLSTPLLS